MAYKAVQQIMLGSVCGSEAQARSTLAAVKAAGYDGVELNDFMITKTPFLVRALTRAAGMPTGKGGALDWPRLMREAGLVTVALHTNLGALKSDAATCVARCRELGTQTAVITGMYRFDYSDPDAVDGLARDLNECGRALLDQGINLLYHNHNCELRRCGDARAYERIVDRTDPELVNFEFDSYWMAEAGVDPAAMMRSLGSRLRMHHINDRGARVEGPQMTPILKSDSMELGCGNMPLAELLGIALDAGVGAVVLESHRNWAEKSPVRSLQVSAEWLNSHM